MSNRVKISASRFVESKPSIDAATALFSQQNFNPLGLVYHSILESGNVAASAFTQYSPSGTTYTLLAEYRLNFSKTYSAAPQVMLFNRDPRSPYGCCPPIGYWQRYSSGATEGGAQLQFKYSVDATGISMYFYGNKSFVNGVYPLGKALDVFWMVLQT